MAAQISQVSKCIQRKMIKSFSEQNERADIAQCPRPANVTQRDWRYRG
jgi:hypothetical protein